MLHTAVLGPLALNSLGINIAQQSVDHPDTFPVVNVELVRRPRLMGEPATGHATRHPDTFLMETPVSAIGPSAKDALFRAGPVPSPTTQPTTRPMAPRLTSPGAVGAPDGVSDPWRTGANRLASGPGRRGPDCRRAETLPPIERELCARRFAVADPTAATARLGQRRLTRAESVRETTFAAVGDQALTDYDERRAPLKPPKPCAGADMMGRCPAIITIPLISSAF